ncbi:MAG TPA: tyrosine-type recombinase/integrase, partial [Mycobacterium sp.]|nr:tyrosine-type recombinase/integrase [Mycobacterium sp.]
IGVRLFLRWCAEHGQTPELSRALIRAWIADILDSGQEPATARARQMAVKRFSAWLAEEGEIDRDELAGLNPPKLDTKVVHRLTDEQCTALIKACDGKQFLDRRDEAILRLMLETGIRAGEAIGMTVGDVNVGAGMAIVRRGKGGKGRTVPFGPQTARAIDRYLRARKTHRLADTLPLWLGGSGQTISYNGLDKALKARATKVGIDGFHLHLLRHTAASRWLAAGGSEGGLMAVAGWSSREMLDRYTRATASDRAAVEARNLNLGDL